MRLPIQGVYIDGAGNIVVSGTATFYEYLSSDPSNPTVIATIYAARTGGSAIASGAVTTDSNGAYIAWVEDTDYDGEDLLTLILNEPTHVEVPWHFVVPGLTITHTHANDANGGNSLTPATVAATGNISTSGGKIGGGTGSPTHGLHIIGDVLLANAPGDDTIIQRDSSNTAVGFVDMGLTISNEDATAGNYAQLQFRHNAVNYAKIACVFEDKTGASEDAELAFMTMKAGTLTEHMRIDNDGNVGIGTATPDVALHVVGDVYALNTTSAVFERVSTNAAPLGTDFGLTIENSNTTVNNYANLQFRSDTSTTADVLFAKLGAIFADHTNGSEDADLFFASMKAGTMTEHMRIDSDGQTALGLADPDARLHIVGDLTNEITLLLANNDTDATSKLSRMGTNHYTNAEQYFINLYATTGSSANVLSLGGGDSQGNAATSVLIYAAADNTTVSGTQIVKVTTDGLKIVAPATLILGETVEPSAEVNFGKVYTKSDNKLYFQDGAGTEHELAFVP